MEEQIYSKSTEARTAEGGCGVIGLAASVPIAGRHLLTPLQQMRNRGNGKGGGIAAAGLIPSAFHVSKEILENDYLLAIGYLDQTARAEVEKEFIYNGFFVDHVHEMKQNTKLSFPVKPPEAVVYFVRPKGENGDEFVYQNSYQLNKKFYATDEKKAFVLSHGKNLLVLKMVGYGDDVISAYQLEDFAAHVWIGHHRYPTKGRVWHPGGAHPFVGLHEALVHNGDFANYLSMCEYLAQRDITPLFMTDTEVSVLIFDLLHRTYNYPLEYVIESLAPTTERDFTLLSYEKQRAYRALQKTHMHGSPDGPWFFLVAQSIQNCFKLIGITDTSMLRPQVFALYEGAASIALSGSEKQAIDAALLSLSKEDSRFTSRADLYWSARGGSYNDGGAFIFSVENGKLKATNKFGHPITISSKKSSYTHKSEKITSEHLPDKPERELISWVKEKLQHWHYSDVERCLASLQKDPRGVGVMTYLIDHHFPTTHLRKSSLLSMIDASLAKTFKPDQQTLDASHFPVDGEDSLAREIVKRYQSGVKTFTLFNCRGHRFIGNGLGPNSSGVNIHVYGSSGDYLASGIDGAKFFVHGSAQDQLAQIMKEGQLVIYGDVGQTLLYGAKGGVVYIQGSAAGRPLINAVGRTRAIINGTCLDYLAESFMAGNPLKGGGFVVLNGITFDDEGTIIDLESPYPGGNLFSLASGGALYIRDPRGLVSEAELNGGTLHEVTEEDWQLLLPYLQENERLFEIPLARLLEHEGRTLSYSQIYRKVSPAHAHILMAEEAWIKGKFSR